MSAKNELTDWFRRQQDESTMKIEKYPLNFMDDWCSNGRTIERRDEAFFRVASIRVKKAAREVSEWEQPIFEETGDIGVVSLIRSETSGKILITAKQEPGNDTKGCVLLAPSYQASASNLEQIHGGSSPPLADIMGLEKVKVLQSSDQHQDGGRFLRKRVRIQVISIPNENYIARFVGENQRWSTVAEVTDAIRKGLTNIYLRETFLQLLLQEGESS